MYISYILDIQILTSNYQSGPTGGVYHKYADLTSNQALQCLLKLAYSTKYSQAVTNPNINVTFQSGPTGGVYHKYADLIRHYNAE